MIRYRYQLQQPTEPAIPPRVQAALNYLGHCRERTHTCDPLVPAVGLSKRERAVEDHALGVLSLYFMGEMDFVEPRVPTPPVRPNDDDNDAPQRVVA